MGSFGGAGFVAVVGFAVVVGSVAVVGLGDGVKVGSVGAELGDGMAPLADGVE